MTNVDGTLFFTANDGVSGAELWKSDGTAAGTVLVKDIVPGGSSSPALLTNVGGTLFFRATDAANDVELWKSDGTAAGTVLVKDIRAGSTSSLPENLTNVGGTLLFSADAREHGRELWRVNELPEVTNIRVHWGTAGVASVANLGVLPWQNIHKIEIVFSENVTLDAADLSLLGVNVGNYNFTFSYNTASFTATLTLAAPLGVDRLTLGVSGSPPNGVRDRFDGRLLGGDYAKVVKVLPGDVNGDGKVDSSDLVRIRNKYTSTAVAYDALFDVNGDGVVNITDYVEARKYVGKVPPP